MQFPKNSMGWRRAVLLAACAWMTSGAVQAAPTPRYTVQSVGEVQGLVSDNAAAFNDLGDVTGTAYFRADPVQGYVSRDGRMRILPSPGGFPSQGQDINNHGDVVGINYSPGGLRPVLWRDGKPMDLRPILGLGQQPAFTNRINDAGQITGYAGAPFFYDGSRTHYLGLAGFTMGTPTDLAENGMVLLSGFDTHSALRSWLYRDENYTLLPSPVDYVQFQAVNDLGQVVGYSRDSQTPGSGNGLYLYSGGEIRRLEPYGGATTEITQAFAINNQGWIVGELYLDGNSSRRESFLYRDDKMYLFRDLVRHSQVKDWDYQFIYDVNEAGQLLGMGGMDGKIHSFVASPVPEPSHGLLMLVGLGLAGAQVHRRKARLPN